MSNFFGWSVKDTFDRYEEIRSRLPCANFPRISQNCSGLVQISEQFDAVLLDGFGVLNVGETPIPGSHGCISILRDMGKRLVVLTNAASYPNEVLVERYHRMGFDFAAEEIVSSRDVCARRLNAVAPGARWGALAARGDRFEEFDVEVIRWDATCRNEEVDGFLLLSSADLDSETVIALEAELRKQQRPLVVANPDLVAPREEGLSLEPGYFAHNLADKLNLVPFFFGKPFGEAFRDAIATLEGVELDRIIMVGDTLHTDILGGTAAGIRTALVKDFGLFAGVPVGRFVRESGIVPAFECGMI